MKDSSHGSLRDLIKRSAISNWLTTKSIPSTSAIYRPNRSIEILIPQSRRNPIEWCSVTCSQSTKRSRAIEDCIPSIPIGQIWARFEFDFPLMLHSQVSIDSLHSFSFRWYIFFSFPSSSHFQSVTQSVSQSVSQSVCHSVCLSVSPSLSISFYLYLSGASLLSSQFLYRSLVPVSAHMYPTHAKNSSSNNNNNNNNKQQQ